MLELTVSFNTIDFGILLSRLTHRLGVTGAVLEWFRSYLSRRQQLVRIGSDKSSPTPVLFGVPQGFVLGPLLFTAYITPLGDNIRNFGLDHQLYADDTQIYVSFCPDGDDQLNTIERLCNCIEEIRE